MRSSLHQSLGFSGPFLLCVIATVGISMVLGQATAALALAVVGAALLAAGAIWTGRRHGRVAADLRALTNELGSMDLPDLTSLHPGTEAGRNIADSLAILLVRVQDAVAEEDRLRREVEAAQALRVNFVASMGHDLRGPLNSMLGFAELLLLDDDETSLAQQASVHTIRQRTLDLLTLIDEMLDWAKLETGSLPLNLDRVSASDLSKAVRKLAEQRSAGRGLVLNIDVAERAPDVRVDTRHLPRAVVAALGDAIRGPALAPVSLAVSGMAGGELLMVVHDPTLLIRDEDQAQFFEAFRPSYAPSGKRIAGLGLGAACAKSIFVAHGGKVRFESSAQEGTRFYMTLPAYEPAQAS